MIEGYFDPVSSLPFVTVAIVAPGVWDDWILIDFVVDTGASRTVVNARDLFRHFGDGSDVSLRMAERRIVMMRGVSGVVGFRMCEAFLGLQRRDGEWEMISAEVLLAEQANENGEVPSLMGWDLLRAFEIAMNRSTGLVMLDLLPDGAESSIAG